MFLLQIILKMLLCSLFQRQSYQPLHYFKVTVKIALSLLSGMKEY